MTFNTTQQQLMVIHPSSVRMNPTQVLMLAQNAPVSAEHEVAGVSVPQPRETPPSFIRHQTTVTYINSSALCKTPPPPKTRTHTLQCVDAHIPRTCICPASGCWGVCLRVPAGSPPCSSQQCCGCRWCAGLATLHCCGSSATTPAGSRHMSKDLG